MPVTFENTLAFAQARDTADPLRAFRSEFLFPQHHGTDVLYFTGNSLGLQPRAAADALKQELDDWARFGVEGHFQAKHPWYSYHEELTPSLARLVGALPVEVVAMNQLTSNLHFLMVSFYRPEGKRRKILTETRPFPSDTYAFASQIAFHGGDPDKDLVEVQPRPGEHTLRTEDIVARINELGEELALVCFGGVNFYTGQAFDMPAITKAAHAVGAIAGFDLAHAAGNLHLQLHDWNVDFACWCSYKYLNSGPGSVAGAFVHERHLGRHLPLFAGWWGHDKRERFRMERTFKPMPTAEAWQVSNAPVFSMAVHRVALDLFDRAGIAQLRAKSEHLTAYLAFIIAEVAKATGADLEVITPADPAQRGCQLSILAHGHGKALFNRIAERGVVADWREPNVIRVAPVPLYNSFEDVYRFGEILTDVLSDPDMSKKNITVVGGGLVGSLLTVFLAKRGHTVNLFERRPDPRSTNVYAGRSINLVVSHRGWTALKAAGVHDAVERIVVPVYARMTHDRDGKLTRLPYSIDNKAIHSVSRGELNKVMLSEAEKLPNVKLHFEHRCTGVNLDTATCTFHNEATGEHAAVQADLVFGSDGAPSAVRQEMMKGRFNFSQTYIEHDYKEIAFAPNADGTPKMDPQCLHIWPRRFFMMMGLANQDGGFTGTLFMPHSGEFSFDNIKDEKDLMRFFGEHFADAIPLLPDLAEQYFRNPQSNLAIIRCGPWTHKDKVALIGDAAHAIVPFYGEGMNAGYEDCKVLNDLLNEHGDDNWAKVFDAYGRARKPNGDAIADLSLRNFIEMRDLVADPKFILRKKIEGRLQAKHPDKWLPLYSQVKFSDIGYKTAWDEGLRHDRIMEQVLALPNIEEQWESEAVERKALELLAAVR